MNDEYYFLDEALKYLNEDTDMNNGKGAVLRPVFIVLIYANNSFDHLMQTFMKDMTWCHAAISFGPGLTNCYSFNFGEGETNKIKGGFSYESLQMYGIDGENKLMQVNCLLLSNYKYTKLKKSLDWYVENQQKTRYDLVNLVMQLFNKQAKKDGMKLNLVCSTFVDTILKSIDVDLTGKSSSLVKPDDLANQEKYEKYYKIFDGKMSDYDPVKVMKQVEKLANDANNNYFKKNKK